MRLRGSRAVVCAVYVAATFMAGLDTTIVNVALPAIAGEFRVPPEATGAIDVAYLVALAVCTPLSGWLADRYGSRRVFLGALTGFTLASGLCAVAGGLGALVAARAVQGGSAGLLVPVGLALLYRAYAVEERLRINRILVFPVAAAPTLGPVLSGLFVEHLSWRWGFVVNLPIGAAAFAVAALALREHAGPGQAWPTAARFDLRGFLLAAPGCGLAMYALTQGPSRGWTAPDVLLAAPAAAVLLTALVVTQRRTAHPLLEFGLFGDRAFRAASRVMVLQVSGFLAITYVFPLLYQAAAGASAVATGLAVLPKPLGLMVASQLAGRLHERYGSRRVVTAAMAGAAVTFGLHTVAVTGAPPLALAVLQFAAGFCVGQATVQLGMIAFATIGTAATASASTLYNAQRNLANATGVALAAAVLAGIGTTRIAASGAAEPNLTAYTGAILAATALAAAAALFALAIPDIKTGTDGPGGNPETTKEDEAPMPAVDETPTRPEGLRVLEVLRTSRISPRMLRVTLGGEEIAGLEVEGPNVKLFIPPAGDTPPRWPTRGPDGKPVFPAEPYALAMRTYTVRRYDEAAGELDIDFVLHDHAGPASGWAAKAVPGDVIGLMGPGGRVVKPAEWYLLAGDETAIPAIATTLERLPAGARGQAFIEVADAAERQDLRFEADVEVVWLDRKGAAPGSTALLEEAVRGVDWPHGRRVFAWIAGESAAVRAIRNHLRKECGVGREQHLAIGYWKRGLDEDRYHEEHDNDRDADYYAAARA